MDLAVLQGFLPRYCIFDVATTTATAAAATTATTATVAAVTSTGTTNYSKRATVCSNR